MKRWPRHLLNELRRTWALKRRYWFETLLALGFLVAMFCGLLFAVVSVGGRSLASGEADGLIVGFAVWLFALSACGSASQDVQQETEQRTLEQLCIAPLPLWGLLALRAVLTLLGALLTLLVALGLAHALTGGRLQGDWFATIAACLLAAPALVGLGYALAGVMLLAKKAELLLTAMFPVVIGLVALPAYPVNALSLLPYALGAATARATTAGAQPEPLVWLLIALNALVWAVLGGLVYAWTERRARQLGVLGHF
jgi:ABC-2 type transport system permease protein